MWSIGVTRPSQLSCSGWLLCWPSQARHLPLSSAHGCFVFIQVKSTSIATQWLQICWCLLNYHHVQIHNVTSASGFLRKMRPILTEFSQEIIQQRLKPPHHSLGFYLDKHVSPPQVMISSRGSLSRTLWFPYPMLPPAQGLHLCVWVASTCWCLCLSSVPCSS